MDKAMINLAIVSPAFENGGWIPDEYSGYGEDVSPEIRVHGIPENAKSLVITLDDMGHPIQPGYNHWVIWNMPPMDIIPRAIPSGAKIDAPLCAVQGIAFGKHRYRGPKPPFNWNHEYLFTVYALDDLLAAGADSRKSDIVKAMEGHILGRGELRGKYQRRHRMPRTDIQTADASSMLKKD